MPPPPSDPTPAKPQWPWIVGSAVIIAGLAIAIALFLSRSHKVETVIISGGPPVSIAPSTGIGTGASASPSSTEDGGNAGDQSTQQLLEQAATSAKTIDSTTGSLMRANSLGLAPSFPSVTFKQAFDPSTGPTELSLSTTPTIWAAAALSNSGTCWWIKVDGTIDGATYGSGEPCTGQSAATAAEASWPAAPASPTPSP